MKKLVALVVCLCIGQIITSQNFKFGKVSIEELTEEKHHLDEEAVAAVLYRYQRVYFEYERDEGFVQKKQIHERIKIYNKEGYDFATKNIKLYDANNNTGEKLVAIKAYTYTKEKGKVKKTKLKSGDIFSEKINEYWRSKKFTMPNLQEGCVIEYTYTIKTPMAQIDDVYFQNTIPINKLEVKIESPEWYKYKVLFNPKATYVPQMNNSVEERNVNISYYERADAGVNGGSATPTLVSFDKAIDFDVIDVNEMNIPAIKDEEFTPNLSNYVSKLKVELTALNYPNQPYKNLSTSWEKVSEVIYKDDNFGLQLNKNNYYKSDLNQLLEQTNSTQEIVGTIFQFVKSKVKWNGFNGVYSDKGVSKAYKEGEGNVADINLMLISMLRTAGVNANPVLVSTRSHGIPLLPTRSGFNYVICMVEMANGYMLLDATTEFSSPNILPKRVLNWKGRLIKGDNASQWVNLEPTVKSKEIVSMLMSFDEEWAAIGKVRTNKTNYFAFNYREESAHLADEQLMKNIESGNAELEVSKIDVKNVKDLSKPIIESYEYKYNFAAEKIGDKLYVSPLLFLKTEENPFKEDERVFPIDFVYPTNYKYLINVVIPEGYVAESIPENIKAAFNENEGSFSCFTKLNGNMLQISFDLSINKSLILPEEYPKFKQFFQAMIDAQDEKIVLKKAELE